MSLSTLSWVGSNFFKQKLFISVLGRIPKYKCLCEENNLKYINIKDLDFSKGYKSKKFDSEIPISFIKHWDT
jgi:hypothetical protein